MHGLGFAQEVLGEDRALRFSGDDSDKYDRNDRDWQLSVSAGYGSETEYEISNTMESCHF